jgi:hypothetical protein
VSRDPTTRPAALWTLDDLAQVVATERPESFSLEFKRDLPLADGAIGWRAKGRLHASERDGIAREVTALANQYGGALIVGIDEASDPPSRAANLAEPLPRIFDLVDRMRDALASIVDPPIPGLDIAGVESADNASTGYLVITVPQSQHRPHGYGTPPQVYIRRDDNAVPASMQEISGMFWEARTNRERISGELVRATELLENFQPQSDLSFQFVAVSERQLSAVRLPEAMLSGEVIGSRSSYSTFEPSDAAEFPNNYQSWQPNAVGVDYRADERSTRRRGSVWTIDETGVLTVTGSNNLPNTENGELKQLYPGWYAKTCGSLIGLAHLFSSWVGFEGDWVVAGTFSGPSHVFATQGEHWNEGRVVDLSSSVRIRPVRISRTPSDEELTNLAAKIWAAFGLLVPENAYPAIHNGLRHSLQFEVKQPAKGPAA